MIGGTMPDGKSVIEQLSKQCTTVESLRDFFNQRGITGKTANFSECVLAVYLTEQTGERWGVTSDAAQRFPINSKWREAPETSVDLPDVLGEFVYMFDEGDFPELISQDDSLYWNRKRNNA